MFAQLTTVDELNNLLHTWEIAALDHADYAQQALLLGLNTTINYDLVFELVDVLSPECDTLSPEGRQRDRRTFDAVIRQFKNLINESFARLTEQGVAQPIAGWMLEDVIDAWAENVWRYSDALLRSHSQFETESIRYQVERRTAKRADAIRQSAGLSRQIA